MGVSPDSRFEPMRDHAATEDALEASGVPFTSLRNGFYAASGTMLLGQALETGELVAPEDGPVSWTTHADLAEAAAIILTEGGFDGPTPPLTAAEALDLHAVAQRSGKADHPQRRQRRRVSPGADRARRSGSPGGHARRPVRSQPRQ